MVSMALTSVMAAFVSDIANATDVVYGDISNNIRRTTIGGSASSGSIIISWGTQPAVSPDGQWIAYKRTADGGKIYVKQLSSAGNGTAITSVSGSGPTWSPDSQTVAYTVGVGQLFSRNNHWSGPEVEMTINPEAEFPIYSTDGNYLYYTNNTYGGIFRVQVGNPASWTQWWSTDLMSWPAFAPGGLFALYKENLTGVRFATVANPDTSTLYISTSIPTSPSYSPDGQWVWYMGASGYIYVRPNNLSPLVPGMQVTNLAANIWRPAFAPTASTGSNTSSGIALVDNIVGKGVNWAGSLLGGNTGTIIAGILALSLLVLLIYSIWRILYKSDNRGRE